MKTKQQLEWKIDELDLQIQDLISTNSKLADQLKNFWDEIGCKNDLIKELKEDLSEIKLDRNKYASRWKRCIADKYEQKQKEDEADKAIFEKALSGERTDN